MRPLPLILTLLLLVACAQPEEGDVALDEEAAGALAQGAQRLGFALDDGDACGAMAEADAVRSQARDGVRSGTVPTDVANEVDAVASEVTADLTCEADDGTDEEDAEAEENDTDEPEPEPEPAPDDPDDEKRKDDKDDKDDEDDEDGPRGGGPDGDGPPGQADGGDRGSNRGGGR